MYLISDRQMEEAVRLLARLGRKGAEPTEEQRRRCRVLARALARKSRATRGRGGDGSGGYTSA